MRKVTANTEIKMISLNCRRVDQNITTTVSHHFELFVCVYKCSQCVHSPAECHHQSSERSCALQYGSCRTLVVEVSSKVGTSQIKARAISNSNWGFSEWGHQHGCCC